MKTVYKAHVFHMDGNRSYFEGEIEGVFMNTNVRELKNEPCVFVSDTKAGLLASMISHLKATGKTGVLRVVN